MDNTVTCNYHFYDSEGVPVQYPYDITVSAIMPGGKQVYVYNKLGELTIKSETIRRDLIESGYSQSIRTERNDTILINKANNKAFLQVPMSYFNRIDTLLFTYSNITSPDTIYLEHDSYAHVDIPECGSYRYHGLIKARATGNAIDHIEIVNPTVNYDKKENIKIYFNGTASAE